VPKRIFGPKRAGKTGEWRRLHNEELHNLFPSPNIMKLIQSNKMTLVEYVAHMEMRNT
jgi:hypothetical protein